MEGRVEMRLTQKGCALAALLRAQLLPWALASRPGSVVVIVGADLLQRGPSHRTLRNEEGWLG